MFSTRGAWRQRIHKSLPFLSLRAMVASCPSEVSASGRRCSRALMLTQQQSCWRAASETLQKETASAMRCWHRRRRS